MKKIKIDQLADQLAEIERQTLSLEENIKSYLMDILQGTSEEKPLKVNLSLNLEEGLDGVCLYNMHILGVFWDNNVDGIYFIPEGEDPHSLDYLRLNEQVQLVNEALNNVPYVVWPDSESAHSTYRNFSSLEEATNYASRFVHQFDGETFRVILHVEDNARRETIDTVENIRS